MGTPEHDPGRERTVGHEVAAARHAEHGEDPGGGALGSEPRHTPSGEASAAIRSQLHEGMEVRGADTNRIGFLKELREHDFLVNRQMLRDIFIPFDFIEAVVEERVILTLNQAEVNQRDWPGPRILG